MNLLHDKRCACIWPGGVPCDCGLRLGPMMDMQGYPICERCHTRLDDIHIYCGSCWEIVQREKEARPV
jgi:hypothetical protein